MRVFKLFVVCLLITSLFSSLAAQKTIEKTLVKAFNLQGNDQIELDIVGDIEIKQWNSPSMRIEMLVTLENGNETMLKSLVKAGRYNLISEQTAETFLITMPDIDREIVVRGEPLVDNVSYIISIPQGAAVVGDDKITAGLD